MFGSVGFGAAARSLERRGVSVYAFCGAGMTLFVVTQILMVLRVPLPPTTLIAAYGAFGSTGILCYAVAAQYFPPHMAGRQYDAHASHLPADFRLSGRRRRDAVDVASVGGALSGVGAWRGVGGADRAAGRERGVVHAAEQRDEKARQRRAGSEKRRLNEPSRKQGRGQRANLRTIKQTVPKFGRFVKLKL